MLFVHTLYYVVCAYTVMLFVHTYCIIMLFVHTYCIIIFCAYLSLCCLCIPLYHYAVCAYLLYSLCCLCIPTVFMCLCIPTVSLWFVHTYVSLCCLCIPTVIIIPCIIMCCVHTYCIIML